MSRARFGAVLALLVAGACDGEFRFDQPTGASLGTGGAGSTSSGVAGYDEAAEEGFGGARDADNCAHCADFGLKCATEWESCVECIDDDDCSASLPYCDPQMHRCLPCNTIDGCATGNVCDGWSHACMRTCATESDPDLDCDGGPSMCDQKRNVCVACLHDSDCHDPALPYCAPGGALCAECASDRNCSPGWHCDQLSFTCVVCRDSRDCPNDDVCDPTSHACVATNVGER